MKYEALSPFLVIHDVYSDLLRRFVFLFEYVSIFLYERGFTLCRSVGFVLGLF